MRPKGDERRTAHIIVRVTKENHKAMNALAKKQGVSVSDMIRTALQQQGIEVEGQKK